MIEFDIKNYGYYDSPDQAEPKYDPGETAPCLICGKPWTKQSVRTIGVRADDERSWFYRVHQKCHNNLTEDEKTELDGLLIDRIPTNKPREAVDKIIEESDHLPEASTSNNGSGGSAAPLPTWTKAVEEALLNHKIEWQSWRGQRPEGDAFGLKFNPTAEALASIQDSTADLLLELVGEDENHKAKGVEGFHNTPRYIRNKFRAELRTKIADLRAEGGGEPPTANFRGWTWDGENREWIPPVESLPEDKK